MSRILLIFSLFASILFSACKNDIEINAPYKDVGVVYGFLDQNQDTQFVRIEKTYQNSTQVGVHVGGSNADSLNFDSLSVQLIDQTDTWKKYPMKRAYTYVKDSGYFTTVSAIYYAADSIPQGATIPIPHADNTRNIPRDDSRDYAYRLEITHPSTGATFSAKANIVHDAKQNYSGSILVKYDSTSNFPYRFYSAKFGYLYDLVIRFHYLESNADDSSQYQARYVDYVFQSNYPTIGYQTASVSFKVPSITFILGLKHLFDKVTPLYPNVKRKAIRPEYVFYGGSKEFSTLLDITRTDPSIVSKRPDYNINIEPRDASLGIFSSRNSVVHSNLYFAAESFKTFADY